MGRLDGKTAVVTGGADGIGHAIADAMTREGAHVFVGDIDDAKGSAFVAELVKAGRKADYLHCDVSQEKDIAGLIAGGGRKDRPPRHPRQQRGDRHRRHAGARNDRRTVAPADRGQPHQRFSRLQVCAAAHDPAEVRLDHQHGLGAGPYRARRLDRLRRRQGRGDVDDPPDGGRVRPAQCARQLDLAGHDQHADERESHRRPRREGRSCLGEDASPSAASATPRKLPKRRSISQATPPASPPASTSASTAVSPPRRATSPISSESVEHSNEQGPRRRHHPRFQPSAAGAVRDAAARRHGRQRHQDRTRRRGRHVPLDDLLRQVGRRLGEPELPRLEPQQAVDRAEPQEPQGARDHHGYGQEGRRGGAEFPARRAGPARLWL